MVSRDTPVLHQLSESTPLLMSIMASLSGFYDSHMLHTDCENAIQLYSKVGKHIQRLSSLKAAAKLKKFLMTTTCAESGGAEILKRLQNAACLYDKAELAGREYARKARSCAEENILVANGILEGKKYYQPQDILEAFEDMVDGLLKEYDVVITKHTVVVQLMNGISSEAGRAKVRAQNEVTEAEKGIARHAPVAAPFIGAVEGAELFSSAVDNVPGKAALGFLGALAGAVKGVISSVIFVPMAVNIANSVKYRNMKEEFEELLKELSEVEYIIKEHRDLLSQINQPVKSLSQKYKSIKGRKELRPAMLDRIVKESKDLITACDNYLRK